MSNLSVPFYIKSSAFCGDHVGLHVTDLAEANKALVDFREIWCRGSLQEVVIQAGDS
jgi:hypothetical protein